MKRKKTPLTISPSCVPPDRTNLQQLQHVYILQHIIPAIYVKPHFDFAAISIPTRARPTRMPALHYFVRVCTSVCVCVFGHNDTRRFTE